ncbi:MAG TPA: RidA family protein [Candidatus Sulfotelmatobacter sp.]
MKKVCHNALLLLLGLALALSSPLSAQDQVRAVVPPQMPARANLFYSPGVDAGDYVYISGQGPRKPDGSLPGSFSEQVTQALDNIRTIVKAAGLDLDHVVYMQVYLEDISKYGDMENTVTRYFGKSQPAQSVLGVAKVSDSPIEINAVAVRSLDGKKPLYTTAGSEDAVPAGMLTHDRLFVSSMAGVDPATGKIPGDPAAQVDLALDRMEAVLKAAGLDLKNLVFVNPYLTSEIPGRIMNEHYARRFEFGNTPARATIQVTALPGGAHIEYTGVAVRDLTKREAVRPKNMPPSPTASPCVFAGDTLYCSAKDGFIPGPHGGVYATTTPHQLRQTMRNQLDNLEEAGMKFDQVVSTTVYLDNLSDVSVFDEVYAQYFGTIPPARTTVQQIAPEERKADKDDHFPGLEQVSLIAVRNRSSR